MCVWMEGTVASVHCVCTPLHNEHSLANQELYICMGSPTTTTGHVTNTNHRLSLISHYNIQELEHVQQLPWKLPSATHASSQQLFRVST